MYITVYVNMSLNLIKFGSKFEVTDLFARYLLTDFKLNLEMYSSTNLLYHTHVSACQKREIKRKKPGS